MLPVSPRLRTLIPEYRAYVVHPYRLGQVPHSVLQVGAANGGRTLRAKRKGISTPVLEGIGLLLDDIRCRADSALEQARVLEHGGVYPVIPEP